MIGAMLAAAAACAPSATVDRSESGEETAHVRRALAAYDSAGFLVGPPDFPIVGRPVVLPGPRDSVFVAFGASMPPSALRFAREDGRVAARYQVTMVIRSDADTLARVDRREIVRVADFAEAALREPRILFQRIVPVPTGSLTVDVAVRELTSRRQAERRFDLEAARGLSRPLVAHRADPRSSLAQTPDVLLDPRHTASPTAARRLLVLVEDAETDAGPDRVEFGVTHEDVIVWADTLVLEARGDGPRRAATALPVHLLPPGAATLTAERLGDGIATTSPLYIGLSPEWVSPSWGESLEHLVHALDSDTLEAWRDTGPGARASRWRRFLDETDPDPATSRNEFLERYFDRMRAANDRFDEPGRAGWETDRGEVLVKLGDADEERFIRPEREGEAPRIEWEYEESMEEPAVIAFEDASEFGVFVLTPRSRATLRRVAGAVRAAERAE